MFVLSVGFLLCMAILLVLWVDVPRLTVSATSVEASAFFEAPPTRLSPPARHLERVVAAVALLLWPLFLAEAIFHWVTRPWSPGWRRYQIASLVFCCCPPLRLGAWTPELGGRIWLPRLGWRRPDRTLRIQLERAFSLPMLWIASLILPVLTIEVWFREPIAEWLWLRLLLHVSTGTVWFAFAMELIVMVSVAERKWAYAKTHWMDIAIVVLPLVSFLRSLRILRATWLVRFTRMQRLAQLLRVYRLRVTAMRLFRAFIVLELFRRLFGVNPARRLVRLREELGHRQAEMDALHEEIAKMETLLAERQAEQEKEAAQANA